MIFTRKKCTYLKDLEKKYEEKKSFENSEREWDRYFSNQYTYDDKDNITFDPLNV